METVTIPEPVQALMRQILSEYAPTRMPRYRYYKGAGGEMYCWTTEPMNNGKFVCWTYRPTGPGSRSGKARRWEPVDRVEFSKRKTAKARAYARYQKSKVIC